MYRSRLLLLNRVTRLINLSLPCNSPCKINLSIFVSRPNSRFIVNDILKLPLYKVCSKLIYCNLLLVGKGQSLLPCPRTRTLYSKDQLNFHPFLYERAHIARNEKGKLFKNLKEKMINSSNLLNYDDLNTIIFLCQKEDLEFMKTVVKHYITTNRDAGVICRFKLGSQIMRVFHHFNSVEMALKIKNDPDLDELFNHTTAYILLMDLLFETEKYEEVIHLMEELKRKEFSVTMPIPQTASYLALCSYYRMNTDEALKNAIDLMKYGEKRGSPHSTAVIAALALNLGKHKYVVEAYDHPQISNYLLQNIIIICRSRLKEYQVAYQHLLFLVEGNRNKIRQPILSETLLAFEETFKDPSISEDKKMEWTKFCTDVRFAKLITNKPLDSLMCKDINMDDSNKNRRILHGNDANAQRKLLLSSFKEVGISKRKL